VSSISIGRPLTRGWMLLVVVVAVAVAGFCVYRLDGIFGSHNTTSTAGGFWNETAPFNLSMWS
jgi:Mycobacterium membrane protein